jgi:hypothetical protein
MKITLGQLKRLVKEEAARKMAAGVMGSKAQSQKGDLDEDDLGLHSPTAPMPVDPALFTESQRGNDENSQHDNDTEPGDPMLKRLKEAALRDIRLADKILRRR